jgi:hypothetical protein
MIRVPERDPTRTRPNQTASLQGCGGRGEGLNIDVDGYAIDDAPLAGDHDAISAMSAAPH